MNIRKIFQFLIFLISTEIFCDNIFYWKINTNQKVIFLTFDDGPNLTTLEILEILKKYNIKATFFVLGELVEFRRDILRKIVEEGHSVGSHAYSHVNFYKLQKMVPLDECKNILKQQLLKTEKVIKEIDNNINIKYLRMPHGFYRKWMDDVIKSFDYKVVNWTFGCDWFNISEEEMFKRYCKALQPGGIYLFHGGKSRKNILRLLDKFINHCLSEGYIFDNLDNWIK